MKSICYQDCRLQCCHRASYGRWLFLYSWCVLFGCLTRHRDSWLFSALTCNWNAGIVSRNGSLSLLFTLHIIFNSTLLWRYVVSHTGPINKFTTAEVHARIVHENPEWDKRFSCNLSLTSALEGGGLSMPRPGCFTPQKDPIPIVQEAGWDPGPVWTVVESRAYIAIRCPDRPARSESLSRRTRQGKVRVLCRCICDYVLSDHDVTVFGL